MKFLSSFFLFLITIHQSFAQKLEGKVIDSRNSIGLMNVKVTNSDSTFTTLTDLNGNFSLPKPDTYTFFIENYTSKTEYLNDVSFHIVELSPLRENLNEIIITSNNFQSKLNSVSSAITVINSHEINSHSNVNIAPILNTIPGVYMHNGTLTTNRITIRGIGSRNLYGTSKIRAYYEDIPLTNGSGASTIEDVEMSTLGRIEVIKGPSSSIYGAGLGGTIQLIPNKGLFTNRSINSKYTFGSYGLQKHLLQANLGNQKNKAKLTYSNLHSDGYRNNNKTDRQTITIASKHFINESNVITLLGSYIDLKAFIPSSINEDSYINNPTSAAFTWGKSKGFKDYKKGLFGISWEHIYNDYTKQKTSVFTSFLSDYEPRPFNILKENTKGIGLRTRLISKTKLLNKSLNWTLGGELFKDSNSYQTYKNLYNEFPPEVGSVQGNLLSDFKEKRSYMNLFFDSNFQLSKNITATFGFNINATSYTLNDLFMDDDIDVSGDYNFNTILSPKFGLTYQLTTHSILYSSISHGFSPPSLEETLLPDGLINTNIKPESGWNYEIGSRGNILNNILHYDVAIYKMVVKDLLVARRTSDDQYIGVNAGKTTYNGVELGLKYSLLNKENLKIYGSNALSYNNFKFDTFINDTEDYSGNDLTGVPKFTLNTSLNFDAKFGLYGLISYNYIGEIPLRDDNTIYSESYQLVNSKIGYKSKNSKKLQFDVFIGLNNIFNEKYASMLLINAGSFGGNAPRYYYPGEPSNYYIGTAIKYRFN
tara:strand:+ start:2430 stop:4715 length:2286 start_codon:yes stop_codon:yes gene_type:complete